MQRRHAHPKEAKVSRQPALPVWQLLEGAILYGGSHDNNKSHENKSKTTLPSLQFCVGVPQRWPPTLLRECSSAQSLVTFDGSGCFPLIPTYERTAHKEVPARATTAPTASDPQGRARVPGQLVESPPRSAPKIIAQSLEPISRPFQNCHSVPAPELSARLPRSAPAATSRSTRCAPSAFFVEPSRRRRCSAPDPSARATRSSNSTIVAPEVAARAPRSRGLGVPSPQQGPYRQRPAPTAAAVKGEVDLYPPAPAPSPEEPQRPHNALAVPGEASGGQSCQLARSAVRLRRNSLKEAGGSATRGSVSRFVAARQKHAALAVSGHCEEVAREDGAYVRLAWRRVFRKYSNDQMVEYADLLNAMEACGFLNPDMSVVDDIYDPISEDKRIGEQEFFTILVRYRQRQRLTWEQAFRHKDGGTGLVRVLALPELLKEVGADPMVHVVKELLHEGYCDETGGINFDEFEDLMELMRERQGFTQREHKTYWEVSTRLDVDSVGEIDASCLSDMLEWLTFPLNSKVVAEILKEVDVDRSGTLDKTEFLSCMRKMRDRQIEVVNDCLGDFHLDTSTELQKFQMMEDTDARKKFGLLVAAIFDQLGYIGDNEAIVDAADAVGWPLRDLDSEQQMVSHLWQVLEAYRLREGFSIDETKRFEEAFAIFQDDCQKVAYTQVGHVLARVGCHLSFELLNCLLDKVDIDHSRRLSLTEVMKIARMHLGKVLDDACERFEQLREIDESMTSLSGPPRSRIINDISAEMAMHELVDMEIVGHFDAFNHGEFNSKYADKEGRVSLRHFLCAAVDYCKASREIRRRHCGFSDNEVEKHLQAFNRYDKDIARGTPCRARLVTAFHDCFGENVGSVGFNQFLCFMQCCNELSESQRMEKFHRAILRTGFHRQEIAGFRELFLAADADKDGLLSVEDARGLINEVMPLNDHETHLFTPLYIAALNLIGSDQSEAPEVASFGSDGGGDDEPLVWLRALQARIAGVGGGDRVGAAGKRRFSLIGSRRQSLCGVRQLFEASTGAMEIAPPVPQQPSARPMRGRWSKAASTALKPMDFPSFLCLMWIILTANFARIRTRSANIAERRGDSK